MATVEKIHVLFLGRGELLKEISTNGIRVTVVPPLDGVTPPPDDPPDLIFLEQGQPYTLSLESAAVPVIIITETDSEGRAATAQGAADYVLYRNLDTTTFQKCVHNTLRHHRLHLEARGYAAALHDSEERFKQVVEMSPDGILIIDHEGQITFANPAAFRMFEREHSDLIEKPFGFPIVVGEANEIKLLRSDGELCYAEMRATEMFWENQPAFLAVLRDVTERRLIEIAEREQRIYAEALRDSIFSLTASLDLAEVLNRILENLAQVIPHDSSNVMLIEAESDEAKIVRLRGYTPDSEQELYRLSLPVTEIKTLEEMRTSRQPVLIREVSQYQDWVVVLPEDVIASYIGAPLLVQNQVVGYVNLNSYTANFFTENHREVLRVFAAQAANAIQNAQLHEQAQHVAALEERQRLARDLHDAVSQSLFSSSVIAQTLPHLKEKNPELLWQNLDKLQRLNRGALAEMRSLLLELRPEMFESNSLFDLIKQYADSVMGRTSLQILINVLGTIELPIDVKLAFYRIMQEALNNVIKHAQATHVEINLTMEDQVSRLTIRDNGKGFEPVKRPTGRMGLRNMRERAASIEADFNIESNPGKGTVITITWRESSS